MKSDQTDYELFISYARLDNKPIPSSYSYGWVTAVREFLVADHRQYSADPMRIFFDTDEIRDMDDWRHRIQGSLRRSKVLLICLSPNYDRSDPCLWEWKEYFSRQAHQLIGSDPIATIYFVEVPSATTRDRDRLKVVFAKHFTDLRDAFSAGPAALELDEVKAKLAVLGQSVWERLERARRALRVPGNLRAVTPYFLGRDRELGELHELVGVGKIGLVAAVHGLGGQGKTELSIAYARGYADCYPLGLWALGAENKSELLPLLGELAFKPEFGYKPTDGAKNDAMMAGREVLAELQRRFEEAKTKHPMAEPAALVLLDNVSEASLLAVTQLSQLPKVDWLRIIATTRLDPDPLDRNGVNLGTVYVDALNDETALQLIRDHLHGKRFCTAEDEFASREIVRELGGFTLAVEQVAVFLAVNPEVAPTDYLVRLRAEGLHTTDALVEDATVEQQIEHQQKRLRPVLEAMLAPLAPAARTLLGFASLLPPDSIPWPWLKQLTVARHKDLGDIKPGYPDPWVALRRGLEGLRLLTSGDRVNCGRMHRLIAAYLRAFRSNTAEQLAELAEFLSQVRTPFLADVPIDAYMTAWHMMPATAHMSTRVREEAIRTAADTAEVAEKWVELAYQLGDLGLEEWWLDRWEQTCSRGRETAPMRAAFLHRKGATREACALLKQTLAAGPHFLLSSQLLMYLAQIGEHMEAHELADSIERDHAALLSSDHLVRARFLHRKYFILHELELNRAAREANRFTLEIYTSRGLEYDSLIAKVNLGDTLWALGQVDESITLLRSALDRSRVLGLSHVENISSVCLANVLSANGEYSAANTLYSQGVELSERIGHKWDQLYARTYRLMSEVEQGRGDPDAFDEIRDTAARAGYEYIVALTDSFRCAVTFVSGRPVPPAVVARARHSPFASCRLYAISAVIRDARVSRVPISAPQAAEWAGELRKIQGIKGRVGVIARTADWLLQSGTLDEQTAAGITEWIREYVSHSRIPYYHSRYAIPDTN